MTHLVDNARNWWKLWSIRLNAIGLAILGWISFDPVGVLAVWNMMPPAVHDNFPPRTMLVIGGLFFMLSMIARLVKQPNVK
jgi:uncharacterized membrane protein YGL010W